MSDLKAKHTPGPWRVEDDRKPGDDLPWRSTGHVWGDQRHEGHPGTLVSVVDCRKLHADSPVQEIEMFEANARLIAAAPELLGALYDICKIVRENGQILPIAETAACLNRCHEVYLKATGGEE